MSGLKSRAHLIRKNTYPTSLISSSLTQLGALYEMFFPTWRRSSTQPAQVSIAAVRFAPISSWMCKFDISFFVITFLASVWAHFAMSSWFVSQTFAMESFWRSREQFFSRSQLLKATEAIFSRHTAFVCGGNPCSEGLLSHVQFLVTAPTFYKQGHTASLTHRVQRSCGLGWDIRADHPDVPAVGHDVFSLFELVDAFSSSLLSYAWIIREVGVRYAFFRFFSFYQFLRLLSKVDKDGLSGFSPDTLSGIKRLIDEIRSFKCVCKRPCVKAFVCKSVCVSKCLCIKAFVCKTVCV